MGIGPFIVHRKGQPRLRLAFLTDAYLLAEQRFDIQPLRLQDFTQTAQAFNLNLANTFTGEANFTTYIFQCCRFVPQQTESTCQHFTLIGSPMVALMIAPFDAIIVTAAPPEIPTALMTQLDEGGILVLPVGEEHQYLKRVRRRGGEFIIDTVEAVRFVPLVKGELA
jgi:hypothetical protein